MIIKNKTLTVLKNNNYYPLSLDTDILSSQNISKYLSRNSNNFDITVYQSINSTNTFIKELAIKGYKEGTVIIAEEQTEGRGKFDRKFYSPKGTGIYMSILLRPQISASESFLITTAAAVSVSSAIDAISGKEAKIKWVNDIYCDDKKVCGILTEASLDLESGGLEYAILGIGINVTPPKTGFPEEIKDIASGILNTETFDLTDVRSKLVAKFLEIFWSYYKNIDQKTFLTDYKRKSLLIGKEVFINSKNSSKKALVLDIDDECRLKVRMEDGTIQFLSSGEVSVKKI